ncbi:hypothetical protein RB195_009251 [Necator americanus]
MVSLRPQSQHNYTRLQVVLSRLHLSHKSVGEGKLFINTEDRRASVHIPSQDMDYANARDDNVPDLRCCHVNEDKRKLNLVRDTLQ